MNNTMVAAMIPLTFLLGLLGAPALAADGGIQPQAVQNREHTMSNEYALWVGSLPMDAFTKGLTFSGAYTMHFSDLLAWEVAQFTWSLGIDTRLATELEALPQPVGTTPFEVVRYYGTTNVVVKPLYGKLALFNRNLIYQEWFAVVGGGVGRLTLTTRPVVDLGIGTRIFAGEHLSFRLDVREYLFVSTDDLENELWVAMGLSLAFGSGGS